MSDCVNNGCIAFPEHCLKDKPGFVCYGYMPPKKTKADYIRSMSDEELAEFFAELPCCPPGDLAELCYPNDSCEGTGLQVKCWLDWLRQEVKDGKTAL